MSGLKTFAVLGAGAIGAPIIDAFLDAKQPLTILTRDVNKPELQGYKSRGATLKAVDYASVDSIAAALEGVDALISALGNNIAPELPTNIVLAAKQAGVKAYVPSEYGLDYSHPRVAPLHPLVQAKVDHRAVAEKHGLPWISITNSSFGQWVYHPVFGYDVPNRTVLVRGDLDTPASATDTRDIGAFTLKVLTTQPVPAPGSGKVYRVEGYETTPRKAIAALEKASGGHKYTVTQVSLDESRAKQTDPSFDGFIAWLQTAFADGRAKLEENDNDLVGFKPRYFLDDHARLAVEEAAKAA